MPEENNGASGGEGGTGGNPGSNDGGAGGEGGSSNAPTSYTAETLNDGGWRGLVDKEWGEHGSTANFKSVNDLAKSYVNAQNLISGKNVIAHPDAEDADGWNTLYNKLGRPENIEGYEFKLPEGSPDHWTGEGYKTYQDAFKQKAYDSGLSKAQAESQWSFVQEQALKGFNSQTQSQQTMINQNIETVKQEFGANLTSAVNKRDALLNKFGGQEAVDFVKQNPVLNSSPVVLKMFNEIAKNFGEDVINEATLNPGGTMTPSEAQSKVNAMMSDKEGAYKNKKHPDHAMAQKEFSRLVQMTKVKK